MTSAEINALPEPVRSYIHHLETNYGNEAHIIHIIQQNFALEQNVVGLTAALEGSRNAVSDLIRERDEANHHLERVIAERDDALLRIPRIEKLVDEARARADEREGARAAVDRIATKSFDKITRLTLAGAPLISLATIADQRQLRDDERVDPLGSIDLTWGQCRAFRKEAMSS